MKINKNADVSLKLKRINNFTMSIKFYFNTPILGAQKSN